MGAGGAFYFDPTQTGLVRFGEKRFFFSRCVTADRSRRSVFLLTRRGAGLVRLGSFYAVVRIVVSLNGTTVRNESLRQASRLSCRGDFVFVFTMNQN